MSSKKRRREVPFMELGARSLKRLSSFGFVSELFFFFLSACTIIRVLGRAFSYFTSLMRSGNVLVLKYPI